ncbi:MAG TPA: hypothetical protein VH682_18760, partial [Gemmataceae bacterium]
MPIKFTCPHCKRAMIVNEGLAGKKGKCKACQQILTVPNPAIAKPPAAPLTLPSPSAAGDSRVRGGAPKVEIASPPPPPPPPQPVDVEAEAAALFADEPKTEEPVEVKSIDLNCPFCDEPIHFPVDLAGKRAPCSECKRIIKVPELVKKEPKDWRKVDQHGPAGARLPDQPAPEGAWGSTSAGKVGQDTLKKVGVIPTVKPPRTFWQKVRWPVTGVAAVFLLTGLSWGSYRWWVQRGIERAVKEALDYAASPDAEKEAGRLAQAALHLGAGDCYLRGLRGEKDSPAIDARNQFGAALSTLQKAPSSDEGDAVLTDLAVTLVELGGQAHTPETEKGLRIDWNEGPNNLLRATLALIQNPEARREAVRTVSQRLLTRGETQRVLPLVSQVYSTLNEEKAAALAVVGMELFKTDQTAEADKAAEDALKLYDEEKVANGKKKKPLPLRAEVVALSLLLEKKLPKFDKDADENKLNERIGQVEGLARKKLWDEARRKVIGRDELGQFRALLALAVAAVDSKSDDAGEYVENALQAGEKLGNKPELSWSLLRLTELALTAGLSEDRVQTLADGIVANRALRGRAQLAVFRARLEKARQPVEEGA